MHHRTILASLLGPLVLVAACNTNGERSADTDTEVIRSDKANAETTAKWVSGYYVAYQQSIYPPEAVDFTGLTHLLYGRVNPNPNGTINTSPDTSNGVALGRQL